MEMVTLTLDQDELLGLHALAGAMNAGDSSVLDVQSLAKDLLRNGLSTKLNALGLPWAPPSGQASHPLTRGVPVQGSNVTTQPANTNHTGVSPSTIEAEVPQHHGLVYSLWNNQQVRRTALWVSVVAIAVALWGGYVDGWGWTGFRTNDQLWDWLHLLLLPVTFATLPLWLQHADHFSRARQRAYGTAIAVFSLFVLAGYLLPLAWTGFPGNTLWGWLTLILLPATLITIRAWPTTGRDFTAKHGAIVSTLFVLWIVTIIGGYALAWSWTGYEGNTLWDWLQLLLVPIVFPTIVIPTAVRFVSGNVEQRVKDELEKAEAEAKAKEEQLAAGVASSPAAAMPSAAPQATVR